MDNVGLTCLESVWVRKCRTVLRILVLLRTIAENIFELLFFKDLLETIVKFWIVDEPVFPALFVEELHHYRVDELFVWFVLFAVLFKFELCLIVIQLSNFLALQQFGRISLHTMRELFGLAETLEVRVSVTKRELKVMSQEKSGLHWIDAWWYFKEHQHWVQYFFVIDHGPEMLERHVLTNKLLDNLDIPHLQVVHFLLFFLLLFLIFLVLRNLHLIDITSLFLFLIFLFVIFFLIILTFGFGS